MFRTINLKGSNDAAYPKLGMSFTWDAIATYRPSDADTKEFFGAASCGSGINGGYKDQDAAFPAGADVTFYAISGSAGMRVVSSLADYMVGPTMPAGYDHYCPLATVTLGADAQLPGDAGGDITVTGNKVTFANEKFVIDPTISPYLGQATTETFFSLAPWLPGRAVEVTLFLDPQVVSNNGNGATSSCILKFRAARNFQNQSVFAPTVSGGYASAGGADAPCTFPNVSRGFFYQWYDGDAFFTPHSIQHRWLSVYLQSYTLPA